MKHFILVLTLVSFYSCSKETYNDSESWLLPEGLKDCKVFRMQSDYGGYMKVVRCPNSSTTTSYHYGKTEDTTSVVER